MKLQVFDVVVFVGFIAGVLTLGLSKSRKEKTSEDYFLAGRGLLWWLIGFSLIAANISTEQFVGMSGNAASHVGLAIASYEWMAAITLVVVAFCFLPFFLRAGVFTMPEFLEYRYNALARTIMALATILIYMVLLGAVTYSGALTIRTLAAKMGYDVDLAYGSLAIGLIAMLYVAAGGLKACAWADLIQGSALILGGAVILVFALLKLGAAEELAYVVDVETGTVAVKSFAENVGAVDRFWELNAVRMNMFLPADDPILPWTALLVGLWIPNFYYWGLNQYITQRTLGSKSLAQGQKGIVFAAFLKLLIPFVIVVPGIIAFNLYSNDMRMESVKDNATILAKYYKANAETKFMELRESPTDEDITAWKPGRYMIAVYPDQEALDSITTTNPFVLPLTTEAYETLGVEPFTIFESEDSAWKSVHEKHRVVAGMSFADEVEAYNTKTKEAAEAAGESTSKEKPIAHKYDTALGQLLGDVLPQGVGLVGFVVAALLGAVVSSLAAMLNAASTIFSMDIFKRYVAPRASQSVLVFLGRVCVVLFAAVAVIVAPQLGNPNIRNSIFTIIQESQGFISSGILAAFVFGFLVRKGPRMVGVASILTNIVAYGILMLAWPDLQFLNRMAVCFGLCLTVMSVMTTPFSIIIGIVLGGVSYGIIWLQKASLSLEVSLAISYAVCVLITTAVACIRPQGELVEFKRQTEMELKTSKGAVVFGIFVVLLTLALYVIFSPLYLAK